jgi:TetR/AcrR family transcriptional regulator, transcriptional repressor for nem operon
MTRTGRPRAFDTDEALSRALDVFWSRGYAGTSIQDLVDGLGVQRGSLYAAFGDKHSLYLKAVELYARHNRDQLTTMLASGPVLPALREMLLDPGTVTGAAGGRGCLMGNTTAELAPGDEQASLLATAAFEGFIEVVTDALGRAQASGEVTTNQTPRAQASMLLLLFQGSALISRVIGREQLAPGIDAALNSLRALRPVSSLIEGATSHRRSEPRPR